MTRITPELVLVDPHLAEAARALLPDPPDCLAPGPRREPVALAELRSLTELRALAAPVPVVEPVAPAEVVALVEPVAPAEPVTLAEPVVVAEPVALAEPPTPGEALVVPRVVALEPSAPPPVLAPLPLPAGRRPLDDPPRRPTEPWVPPAEMLVLPPAPRRRGRHVVLAGAWVIAAGFVLSPFLAFLPAPSSELPRVVAPRSVAAVQQQQAQKPVEPPATETTQTVGKPAKTDEPSEPAPKKQKPDPTSSAGKKQTTTKPKTTAQTARTTKTKPERAQPAERTAPAPPRTAVVTWPAVEGAVVYNVIFVAGDQRVDVWSKQNRVAIDETKLDSRRPRTYTWFAYAGFSEGDAVRYGDLIAHGTVQVDRRAIPKTKPPEGGQVR